MINSALDRLKETGDLFKGVLGKGIDLAKAIGKAQEVFKYLFKVLTQVFG